MKLSIYSLKKVLFDGEANLLSCRTEMGEITILDNHTTLISVLTKGTARVVEKPFGSAQGKEHFFEVNSGFLEVKKGSKVRCLID